MPATLSGWNPSLTSDHPIPLSLPGGGCRRRRATVVDLGPETEEERASELGRGGAGAGGGGRGGGGVVGAEAEAGRQTGRDRSGGFRGLRSAGGATGSCARRTSSGGFHRKCVRVFLPRSDLSAEEEPSLLATHGSSGFETAIPCGGQTEVVGSRDMSQL
ncbi:hypothetical protein AXG93_3857s1330 [Marchantia polymorpha subsp. ruderalis]|uniref:Uncharacterized protein n=1 Tax=Marchantia polymorpha subsp. ruderalis TaxID=1480154 RepID=A0A176W500_MARPO|nr:hypothetical protein AXG93_3857s1330 [Marchantia polymorpha subsp. ruderalis]